MKTFSLLPAALTGWSAGGRDRPYLVAAPDLTVHQNVGTQATPVYECAQHWSRSGPLEHDARFTEPHAAAADASDFMA